MSRYILLPSNEMDMCKLLPTDDINRDTINLAMSSNLNSFDKSYRKIKNKERLQILSMKIAKSKIYRNSQGKPTDGRTIVDVDFDNAVTDLCNELYSKYYESFYILLHKYNII